MEGGTASVACRSPHAGFHGSIKNSAQDFVVTEIDVQGQLVNSPGALEEPVKNKAGIREFVHRDSVRVKLSEETPSSEVTCDAGNLNSGEGLSQEGLDLSVILSCSVNKTLEQFASTVQGCSEVQKNLEMSLGAFPDKHQRAIVHSAVKSSYPFLMTVTNREEILVREDPDFRALSKLVSVEEAEDFFRFKDAKVPGSTFTFLPDDIKEHRTSVHHFVSRKFGKLMETKSFMTQGRTAITVRLRERGRQDRKRTAADRDEQDIYTGFTLRKENLETLEAISYMAAVLGVLPSDFSYAGIKDKRAVTYQSMVVKKISPERLLAKAYMFERKGIQLSKIRPVSEPLRLGRLAGNHFDLVVRDLKPHKSSSVDLESLVKEAVENVKTRGFVNYYGPQRFGSSQKVQADQVGLALLKEDMNTALRLFLSPEEGDDLENKAKQHFHQTGNAKESLALMPLHKARERLMLRALHRYGSGPEGGNQAWLSLPHSMRVFYLHAYCSRLWNEAACFRLQTLGPRPVQGDLVSAAACRDSQAEEETHASQVHVVTAAEEHDGVFSLDQVVLPMPGNSVKYPENAVGLWYQDRLGQDGLGSCRFRIPSLKLNVPGCYRPLLSYPRNVSYSLHIDEDTQDTGLSAPPSRTSLALSFNLNASCYATVCLREIMKCEL